MKVSDNYPIRDPLTLNDAGEVADQTKGWFLSAISAIINTDTPHINKNFEKEWKTKFIQHSAAEKKAQLLSAIEELKNNTLTHFQLRMCFRTLENIALSPRVSDLNRNGFYSRTVHKDDNHSQAMLGLAYYLKSVLPEDKFLFANYIHGDSIACVKKGKNEKHVSIDKIKLLASKKIAVYIAFKIPESTHKTLMIFRKENTNFTLSIFDSLGINPWKRKKGDESVLSVITDIVKLFSKHCEGLKLEGIDATRQLDRVNCAAFIAFDIITARKLLSEGKQLFSDQTTPNPAFFEITQQPQDIGLTNSLYHRQKSNGINETVNLKATFVALEIFQFFLSEKVQYPDQYSNPDERSGNDEEACRIS